MMKVLYTLNASCRHPTQVFAISQSKVPCFDLMLSITTGHYTSPQNRSYTDVDMLYFVANLCYLDVSVAFDLQIIMSN